LVYYSRQLEAQALAKRRGRLDKDIIAIQCGLNDFSLLRSTKASFSLARLQLFGKW